VSEYEDKNRFSVCTVLMDWSNIVKIRRKAES